MVKQLLDRKGVADAVQDVVKRDLDRRDRLRVYKRHPLAIINIPREVTGSDDSPKSVSVILSNGVENGNQDDLESRNLVLKIGQSRSEIEIVIH